MEMNREKPNEEDSLESDAPEPPEEASESAEAAEPTAEEPAAEGDAPDKLAELEEKYKRTHERLLRTAADLDNFRKRTRRDIDDAVARGRAEVLQEILPVLDSVDLALASAGSDGSAGGIIEGIKMIRKQFFSSTERFKLQAVESVGLAFDPNVHEAVAQVPSDEHPAGCVVEEMRKGYLLDGKLLRASMVIVSRGPAAPEETGEPPQSQRDETASEDPVDETGESIPPENSGETPENEE